MEHLKLASAYAEIELDPGQLSKFLRLRDWLTDEGVRSGGIGPGEGERLERRHLADSLLFATAIPRTTRRIWDLGTGVGLPGVPLAIALPEVEFRLLDRSGRRIDLLRRLIRILDLENCQVEQAEIKDLRPAVECIVSRASLPPDDLGDVCRRLLLPGGVAVTGGSWTERPHHDGWETAEIPAHVLDQTVWLLIMRRE
ncbi:MAG: RsmG family class I SAM-dependent methyltransferase [Acidimicrobiia bacterium]